MSGDIGGALWGTSLFTPSDMRHCDEEYFGNEDTIHPPQLIDLYVPIEYGIGDALGYPGYMMPWWPAMGGFCGDGGLDVSMLQQAPWWDDSYTTPAGSGSNGRLAIVGVTRDQYGSAVGGCTVKMFRTSTDELVSTVLSDGNGAYTITTPYYPDGHYLVVYKAGTPDTFGTTVNTLVGG